MSTVIKTRKAKREPSIASVLRNSFVRFKIDDNQRSISIARTPSAFIRHGTNWEKLVKQQIAGIAKERGLTISSWSPYTDSSGHGLRVSFSETLAAIKDVIQGDIYHDLLEHPLNNKVFRFINATVINGDENKGTVQVTYTHLKPSAKVEMSKALKQIMTEMDKKILGFQSEFIDDDANSDIKALVFTYRDVPILTDADSYRVRNKSEEDED